MTTPTIEALEGRKLPPWIKLGEDGKAELYLDNLLLSTANDCPQKFYYRHVRNLARKGTGGGKSGATELGIWWSRTLELFYKGMKDYQNRVPNAPEPSEHTIVHGAAQAWTEMHMSNPPDIQLEDSFQTLFTGLYDKFRGPEGAVAMASEYWQAFGEHDLRNCKIIAMEMGFGFDRSVLLYEDHQIRLYWCGRPDLIWYEFDTDTLLCVDHKTVDYMKSNFIEKWKPHPQTAGYVKALAMLSQGLGYDKIIDRCMINGAARLRALKPRKVIPRFLRPRPHYNPAELMEWVDRTVRKAKVLLQSWMTDTWLWNESSCHVYAGCPFRLIDKVPPQGREIIMKSDYIEIQPWQPSIKIEEEGTEEEVA